MSVRAVRFAKVLGIFRTIHEIANVSSLPSADCADYTLEDVGFKFDKWPKRSFQL